jgi:SNF2 family DNA or RNA helicase
MQNKIEDIYALINFLRIKPFSVWKNFHTTFVVGFKKGSESKGTDEKLQTLLEGILLRRTKTSEIRGVPIVPDLPQKTIVFVYAVFNQEQQEFYDALESGAIIQLRKYQAEGTLRENISNALVLLLRLRQACIHPRLIKSIKKTVSIEDPTMVKGVDVSSIGGSWSLECSFCHRAPIDPLIVLPCEHQV